MTISTVFRVNDLTPPCVSRLLNDLLPATACLHAAHHRSCITHRATRQEYAIKVLDKGSPQAPYRRCRKTSLVRLGSGHPGIVRLRWAFQDDWSLCELAPFAVILHVEGEAATPLGWVLVIPNWAWPTLSVQGGSCCAHYRFCLNAALSGMSASGNLFILVPLLCRYPFSGGRPIAMTSCRKTDTGAYPRVCVCGAWTEPPTPTFIVVRSVLDGSCLFAIYALTHS